MSLEYIVLNNEQAVRKLRIRSYLIATFSAGIGSLVFDAILHIPNLSSIGFWLESFFWFGWFVGDCLLFQPFLVAIYYPFGY